LLARRQRELNVSNRNTSYQSTTSPSDTTIANLTYIIDLHPAGHKDDSLLTLRG